MSDQHDKEQVHYVPVQIMPDEMDDDEIDLLAMWRTLMDGKWIALGVFLCCILGGVGYALLATPEYEVKVLLAPGTIGFSDKQLPIKASSINEMKEWFASGAYLPEIINRYGIEAVENGTIPSANKGLQLDLPREGKMLTVSLKTPDARMGEQILKDIVSIFAAQEKNYPASKRHMQKLDFQG